MQFDSIDNLSQYAKPLIAAIAEHYETGKINSPKENHMLMSMLALLCEGKLVGYVTKEEPLSPKWQLVEDDELFDI